MFDLKKKIQLLDFVLINTQIDIQMQVYKVYRNKYIAFIDILYRCFYCEL